MNPVIAIMVGKYYIILETHNTTRLKLKHDHANKSEISRRKFITRHGAKLISKNNGIHSSMASL